MYIKVESEWSTCSMYVKQMLLLIGKELNENAMEVQIMGLIDKICLPTLPGDMSQPTSINGDISTRHFLWQGLMRCSRANMEFNTNLIAFFLMPSIYQ